MAQHRRPRAVIAAAAIAALALAGLPATTAVAASDLEVRVTDTTPRGDGTLPFSTTGTWPPSAATGPDGAPTVYSSGTGATATWTIEATTAGVYRVEAAIPDVANSEPNTVYTVSGGAGGSTVTVVDQTAARGTWAALGNVDLEAGEYANVVLRRQATTTGSNTRAGTVRMVADSGAEVPPPADSGLPFTETWSGGTGGWDSLAGDAASWSVEGGEVDAITIDNRAGNSGSYVLPEAEISLPADYRIRTSARIDQYGSSGNLSLLTDVLAPYSHVAQNVAVQFTSAGIKMARPNSKLTVCDGASPVKLGEWFQLEVTRADGILAVHINSELVASIDSAATGGTIALGAYRANARIGGIGIEALDGAPADHPATATGCSWMPSTGAGSPQPVILNQTGFDLGAPKRFTAPHALDGEPFEVVDGSDAVVYEGTVNGAVGDFSDFEPAATGPYRVLVSGTAGFGESYEFGIGANWTERISYELAIEFMSDVRCFFGELGGKALNGTDPECMRGLGWRDSHQMSFELPALVDLYLANPSAIGAITVPEAVYEGIEYPTVEGSPEIARLIAWGAEIYLRGQYDHALMKEQLASFLWVYPELSEWIPVELYDDVRDYLFPIWDKAAYSRYGWHEYTSHTADLTQVYTQLGTGKGEFPIGHSIIPNLRMWQVAEREGRADAEVYLDAAVAQAQWIVDNVDVSDPLVTKGQRQGEYHLMTALATLGMMAPSDLQPAGLTGFAEDWAAVAIERSANMWDFHRYSDTRWTIPSFTGGGSGDDPNESGNILGFPAAAHAASTLIDDATTVARLTEIAQAQIDNIFGRNPTGRAAQFRVNDPSVAFEGLDLGWFSEYQGGYGLLQGSRGVFDGSPKNGHYPFNPGVPNIGHTEGWVTFNTAWLASLSWRAHASTAIEFGTASAPLDGSVTVTLRAPLNMDAAGGNTGEVHVSLNDGPATAVTVAQTGVNALDYTAELDLAEMGVAEGDTVTVSYGLGTFVRSASLAVTAAGEEEPGEGEPGEGEPGEGEPGEGEPGEGEPGEGEPGGPGEPGEGSEPPTTPITPLDPSTFDPSDELDSSHFRLVDGELIAELGAGAAGEWFYAVVHSDPVEVGWFRADADGRVVVPVPDGLPAGDHTLALYAADGELAAWGSFSLAAAPGAGGLADTGLTVGGIALAIAFAASALLAGLALLRRRTRTTEPLA